MPPHHRELVHVPVPVHEGGGAAHGVLEAGELVADVGLQARREDGARVGPREQAAQPRLCLLYTSPSPRD